MGLKHIVNTYLRRHERSRFGLQKNEAKPLKTLSLAQNCTLRPRVQFIPKADPSRPSR